MKPEDMRAIVQLATRTLVDSVSYVEQVHGAVAARAFALSAPASLPARVIHDGIATGVYAVIQRAGLASGLATSELVGAMARAAPAAGSTPRSNLALAILNATIGDELADQGSPLAIRMAVRQGREDVTPRRDALKLAFPEATSKVAVFLHGLAENEESWRLDADRHGVGAESTYGLRLEHDLGYTPVYLRYNTGLHISENGRLLTALLDDVVAAWPAPDVELTLIGHSMGGLVARSACHYAQQQSQPWMSTLRHVFYLGSPHLGAALEQWVSRLSTALCRLDESRPLASILDRRSAGIKDLHGGNLLDEHWSDGPTRSKSPGTEVPLVPGANHYAVSATVTTSHRNPVGRLVGDLLVRPDSARGRSRRGGHIPFPPEHVRHFGGLHHFRLLNHPAVYEAMSEWLDCGSRKRDSASVGTNAEDSLP